MKNTLQLSLLLMLTIILSSSYVKAQWQHSLGLEGGRTGEIIQSDSFLITTCEKIIYRTINNFTTLWDTCPNNTGGGGEFLQLDSCIISYGGLNGMHGMGRSFDNGLTWQWIPGYHETRSMCYIGNTIFLDDANCILKSDDYMDSVELVKCFTTIDFLMLFSYDSLFIAFDYFLGEIYQSVDTGSSWDTITVSGLPTEQTSTFGITYYDNTIWLFGIYGVYYLNPDKTAWIEVNSGITTGKWVWEVVSYNSELYCSVENSGLYKFIPDDSIWTYIENSPKNIGSISDINGELYCGSTSGPVKMDSLGIWHTNFDGLYHREISSLSVLNDTIYVFANNELFKSDANGNNFEKISNVTGSKIIATDSIFYMLSETDVLISIDNALTWDTITAGLERILYHISISDNYYFVAGNRGLFRSRMDSIEWVELENGLYGESINALGVIDSVVIVDDNHANLICISKDHGNHFDTLFNTYDNFYRISVIDNRFYLLDDDLILYSDDMGETWEEINMNNTGCDARSVDQNELYLVVGSSSVSPCLSVSYDNGQTWHSLINNIPYRMHSTLGNITFYNERLFTSSTNNSLWYRDDILTEIPENEITDDKHEKVNLYPNPVKDVITLKLESTPEDCQFRILDIQGREQITGILNMKKTEINLEKLKPGLYIIEVITVSGKTSRKIIKY